MQKYDALYLRGRKKIKKTNLETTDAVREGESYNLKNVGVRAIYDQNKQKHTNKLTSNSAITLVALVITIIVLLILVAVTLNFVLGDSGIIAKARLSKRKNTRGTRFRGRAIKRPRE